jgi:hypothetical protein
MRKLEDKYKFPTETTTPTKNNSDVNPPNSPSKGEELTEEQKFDLNEIENDINEEDDVDIMEFEF